MKVAIGSDHAGFELKAELIELMNELGHEIDDFGTHSEESCDYPDIAHPLANSILDGKNDIGIAICGSANGINMSLNKHNGIRSAICWQEDLASLARQHNNANVIALPARFISSELAKKCVTTFLNTEFEGGRHLRRVNKIDI